MNHVSKTLLISGATGLVGRSLCQALERKGHTVKRLSRSGKADVQWDINAGTIDEDAMKDVDTHTHKRAEEERELPVSSGLQDKLEEEVLEATNQDCCMA